MRAFIAVDIPTTEALRGAAAALKATGAPLKLVDLGIIHLTLKFLGEIPEAQVPQIVEIMRSATAGVTPQRFVLRGMGAFPNLRRLRVVWVGVEPGEPLQSIAKSLEVGCVHLGYPREERPFTPHVTLARAKVPQPQPSVGKVIEAMEEKVFGEFTVEAIALKRSILHPTGPEYHVVAEVRLGQPAG